MKRIEAIIKADKLDSVVDSLTKVGVGGLTITKSQGRGAGERPEVGGGRGTAKYVAPYNIAHTILTVVADDKVGSVVSAITDAASTGTKGDGKIFISTIDEAVDIATKEKNSL